MNLSNRSLLTFALVIMAILSFPAHFSEKARGWTIASLANIWGALVDVKLFLSAPFDRLSEISDAVKTKDQEIQRLLLENHQLGNEIHILKESLEQEFEILAQLKEEPLLATISKQELSRHEKELLELFQLQLMHVPAKVIYRPLNMWNSSLWIDKGKTENRHLGREVIAHNSPVVLGTSIIGIIDYVGEYQSRIRLITDSGCNPSVRIKRGELLLAKGELSGESQPLWRSHQSYLKGVGFNYDFPDEEGPARDLRSGTPLEHNSTRLSHPLVQLNDLLVTTGMDGIFPKGLKAGVVRKIRPLQEGDYTYTLEAESTAGDLNSLTVVFVLPPQKPD